MYNGNAPAGSGPADLKMVPDGYPGPDVYFVSSASLLPWLRAPAKGLAGIGAL